MKLRAKTRKYYKACAYYAYRLLQDIWDKYQIDALDMLDVMDSLQDIMDDDTEMKETLEKELPDNFFVEEGGQ